jgi:hypothetical protein
MKEKLKGNQGIPKTPTYKFIYLFFFIPVLGFTNPTSLKIISSLRLVRKGMQQVGIVVNVSVSNWF